MPTARAIRATPLCSLLLVAVAAPACSVTDRDSRAVEADDDRFLTGCSSSKGCARWRCLWDECAIKGIIWGAAGCAAGGGPAGTLAGFLAGAADCGFGSREAFIEAHDQCVLELIPPVEQPLTGTAGAPCFDPDDPSTYPSITCKSIIDSRTWDKCEIKTLVDAFGIIISYRSCSTVTCGESWGEACQHDLDVCIENTVACDEEDEILLVDDGTCDGPLVVEDFDGDEVASVDDVYLLMRFAHSAPAIADVDGNGVGDERDRDYYVGAVLGVHYGDANLDGQFDSADWVHVMSTGLYETGQPALWRHGDFDGDGLFSSADLVLAMRDGCYEAGPSCPTWNDP